ncbi:GNAT family N-acetyltransferase [Paenarthrobacter sp. YJN-5]|uniref:GNAT family N-acetyltransferase n=1 Tax=Paenarthrobacter sp. YJN-5 TaxID=2735316 RepID=UPI001D0C1362|nr:GNAT family N-acetyltransferase [Paenarthrobacter sp. YJN-5]
MTLTLMRLKPDTSDSVIYKPFSESDDFSGEWWNDSIYGFEPTMHFYAFFAGQYEVARAEIEVQDVINPEYEQPGRPGPYAVVHFFEVSEDHRRRGYGTDAVQLLADRHVGTPLVAFSAGADEFWASQGWDRYEHATEPVDHNLMFVSGR